MITRYRNDRNQLEEAGDASAHTGRDIIMIVDREKLQPDINRIRSMINAPEAIIASLFEDVLEMMQELEYEIMRLKGIDVDHVKITPPLEAEKRGEGGEG